MTENLWRFQEKILTDRLLDCLFGEFKTLFLLVIQAPIIGLLIAWRFHAVTASDFLYFSLALSSLWFGCTNSAREIVKEHSIFSRERLNGLLVTPYVISKIRVFGLLAALQSFLLVIIVNYFVPLEGFILLHIITAFAGTVSGIAIGLLLSSLVATVHQADALVPLVLIPQILFSPIVLPDRFLEGWAYYFDKIMPLTWAYDCFQLLVAKEFDTIQFLQSFGALVLVSVVLFSMTGFVLSQRKPFY